MITQTAVRHRLKLQATLKSILLPRVASVLGPKARVIQRANDIFAPAEPSHNVEICDTLCAILETPAGTTAILHARNSDAGPEGLGRTALLLHWLGVKLEWTFRHLRPDEIRADGAIDLKLTKGAPRTLVSSDYAFLSCENGRLQAVAPLGEPLLGLWDLARHLFRRADPNYFPGKRGTPEGRRILRALSQALPAAEFISCYSLRDQPRQIDLAIVLDLSEATNSVQVVPVAEPSDARNALQIAFESVLHLRGTPFWSRDASQHKRAVSNVVQNLAHFPEIVRVLIPPGAVTATTTDSYVQNVGALLQETITTPRAAANVR